MSFEIILNIIKIFGALGLFIYGMKVMSEGIQKVAGNKLRTGLASLTNNRFGGVLTGFLTTSVIQSSSATTVMIVSFVNAGLLSLRQAIGVIMGANIGTTVTALIIVIFGFKFKITEFALPVLAFAIPLMFSKKDRFKFLGEFLVGFAVLFIGLGALKELVPRELPEETQAFIGQLGSYGFFSTILMVVVGTLVTIVVQSSSAAIAITLTLCNKGIIPFEMAAAIVLGENIGTTITANIAAMVGNTHAKRAARAHLIFNIIGIVWMLIVFTPFLKLIDQLVINLGLGSPFNDVESIEDGLTAFHMSFNIINTFLLIWFVDFIAKVVTRIVPSNTEEEEIFKLKHISSRIVKTPQLSLQEAKLEIQQFGDVLISLGKAGRNLLTSDDPKEIGKLEARITELEEVTDRFDEEVSEFVIQVASEEIGNSNSQEIRNILSICGAFEEIGDEFMRLSKNYQRLNSKKITLNDKQTKELLSLYDQLEEAIATTADNLKKDFNTLNDLPAVEIENKINSKVIKLHKMNLKSIESREYGVKSGMIYKDLITTVEVIGDHLLTISQSAIGKYTEGDDV